MGTIVRVDGETVRQGTEQYTPGVERVEPVESIRVLKDFKVERSLGTGA